MRIHWLIKYYLLAFTLVGLIVFYIEIKEPYVNWNLYPNFKELEIKKIISDKNCEKLSLLYNQEFDLNYEKNVFGFDIRKDNKSIRGLNFLKLLSVTKPFLFFLHIHSSGFDKFTDIREYGFAMLNLLYAFLSTDIFLRGEVASMLQKLF